MRLKWGRWDRNRTYTLRVWSSPRSVCHCPHTSTTSEFYWILRYAVSSCVHLCRHGLLSTLLSSMKRIRQERSRIASACQGCQVESSGAMITDDGQHDVACLQPGLDVPRRLDHLLQRVGP